MALTAGPEDLADVDAVVRRTLASRISDPHLIDDIAQETLLRMARQAPAMPIDEQRAYAVVTARNLLATHFRRRAVHDRHLHRLADDDRHQADPEQRTLDNEERVALTAAMDRVDPDERELLVRHEVGGTDLATLAGEAGVSSGAIAMRLARARANLRLEYLLVFRRLRLPTTQCRPVLLALAAGDQRRQAQLRAVDHVEDCPTCASLLEAMTERNRRVAGWLLIPLGDALRRLWRLLRRHWVMAASAAIVAITGIGLVALVVSRGGDVERGSPAAVVVTSTTPPATSPRTVTSPSSTASVATTVAPTAAPPPSPTPVSSEPAAAPPSVVSSPPPPAPTGGPSPEPAAACPAPQPLDRLDVGATIGCPFAVSTVTVLGVSGSHVSATAGGRTVSIDLMGAGVPVTVVPGVTLRVSGVVQGGAGGQLAVAVQAGDLHVAG
jgi:RNA polymerase sigma factor (sigma-70 family)